MQDSFTDDVIDEIDREKPTTKPDTPPASVPAVVVKADAAATTTERLVNPFAIFRQRNASGAVLFRGDLIKCDHNTGEWLRMHGENAILIGNERFVVNPLELIDTWDKYVSGKRIDRKVYRTIDFEFAPEREVLGDLDESRWELDRSGKRRKDPWARAVYLPLKALSEGELCAFKATGQGAIGEIAELCGMYASADRGGKLPVIEPDARSFESQHGSTIYVPVFRLVDWAFWEGDMPAPPVPLRPASTVSLPTKPATAKLAAPAAAKRGDMDDEIPF
jgi:hypothetical protein